MFQFFREFARRPGKSAPLLFLWACIAWVVRPLFFVVPLSHDNPTHLFKAWHFWNEMLAQGRLRGWSHYWAFGFPSDELVPMGGEAWVALFRLGTLGLLSWPRTYALALAGMIAVVTLSSYALTRRYFGPVAGAVAGVLALFDVGGWCQGGWDWAITWGVWPVSLAMAFALLAIARLEQLAGSGRSRDLVIAGGFIGAALLTHHLPLVVFAVTIPILLLDLWLRPRGARRGTWLEVVAACLLGIALSAFFTVPMLARSSATLDLGVIGPSLDEVGRRLVRFETFQRMWPPILVLACLGAVWAMRAGQNGGLFFTASIVVFLTLSSNVLLEDLHLERALPSLVKVESLRMIVPAKLLLFSLTGHAVAYVFRAPIAALRARATRKYLHQAVAMGAALPLLWVAFPAVSATYFARQTKSDMAEWEDLRAFLAWSAAARTRSRDFYRVAYHFDKHNHLSTVAPVFDPSLYYKIGYTPTQTFRRLTELSEPEVLSALSVRYVLSDRPLSKPNFVLEHTFGELELYRFTGYQPNPFTVIGPGQGRLLEFAPERVRVGITGAGKDSSLKLHVASFDRWEATMNGRVLPISPATVYGHEYPFLMEVPVENGELVFRYVRRAPDLVGLILSLAALPVVGLLVWSSRRGWLVGPMTWMRRRSSFLAGAMVAGVCVVSSVMLLRTRTRERLLPANSLFHRLPSDALKYGDAPCTMTEPLVYSCKSATVAADLVKGLYAGHVCMTTPEPRSTLHLDAKVELGSFLLATYEPVNGRGAISVALDGESIGRVTTRDVQLGPETVLFDTRGHKKRSRLEVNFEGAALHCFDLQVVP